MNARSLLLGGAVLAAVAGLDRPAPSYAKGKPAAPAVQTGVYKVDNPPGYLQMGVPKEYDGTRPYPLFFFLHNAGHGTPDAWVEAWSESLLSKGWIVAGPSLGEGNYDNETSIAPIQQALAKVLETYRIDERRVVLAGQGAGANMAWRMATRVPDAWAGVLALNGEITSGDQGNLKKLGGKSAYLFAGAKDTYYSPSMLEKDKKLLEAYKVAVTVEVKPDWITDFPRTSAPKIAEWVNGVWPPGAYREKSAAVEAALATKDVAASNAAIVALAAELKKNPYPAFEARLDGYRETLNGIGRAMIADAKALLAADPVKALEAAEAAAKCLKGIKPLEAEAVAARTALQKDPVVVAAVKRKQVEAAVAPLYEKAAAAYDKGDLAKALELFRKVAALGESSRKAEADERVKELEVKVAGG
jgi:dienelactone hydrolase